MPPMVSRMFVCAALASFTACIESTDSGEPAALSPEITQQLAAFAGPPSYDYDGVPIALEIDPSRIILSLAPEATTGMEPGPVAMSGKATPPAAAIEALLGRLASLGVSVASGKGQGDALLAALPLQEDHLALSLPPGMGQKAVVALVEELRADPTIDFVAPAYVTQAEREPIILHDRLVVHLRDGAGVEVLERLSEELGTRTLRELGGLGDEYLLTYPRGVDPLAFARLVAAQPGVAWTDPDRTSAFKPSAVPTDPYFANQYYARNTTTVGGVRVDVNAEWAWDLTYGAWSAAAGPLRIAVLDQGVETHHPDLGGFVSLGYDAITNSWSSWGCTDCAINPANDDTHGTAVAGVIFAQHDGVALAGLAPAARLLPIRIFRSGVSTSISQIAMAIDAAWQNNAHVISNSWNGGGGTNTITSAINRATSQGRGGLGSIVVFSAGNPSNRDIGEVRGVSYPATLSNVIAVGAINRSGNLTNYTPEGSELDIVAPSSHYTATCIGDVITTDLLGWRGCNDGPGGDIDSSSTFSGTSAAAPQVAAVAAMVLSRNPSWTESQVRAAILAGADPWGPATRFGRGKLNAFRALVGRITAGISGNSYPSSPGVQTYTANVSGGVAGNSYHWSYAHNSGSFQYGGSASNFSVYVSYNETITVRLTVTNGPDGHSASFTNYIYGPTEPCWPTMTGDIGAAGGGPPSWAIPPPCVL